MSKGFFTSSEIQSQHIPRTAHCGLCGLYKYCKSPKMPPTGKGRKKILVVAEAPGEQEDEHNTQLIGKAGKRLRRSFRRLGVDLDKDCWKTNAVICRREGNKTPDSKTIEACRPNLMKTIKKYQPNIILLLGGVACESLLTTLWRGDLGGVSKWGGYCIPSVKLNSWVIPTFHPSYIMRKSDRILDRIFEKHLRIAVRKKGKPWDIIPDYKNQIEIITRPSQAAKAIKEIMKKGGVMASDFETNCLRPDGEGTEIVSCSICWRGKKTIAYPWRGDAIEATDKLFKSPCSKIASNMKFEDRWAKAKLGHSIKGWLWDTMIAAHVIDNTPGVTGLKFQAFVLLGMELYDEHISPYLKSAKGSKFNRIHQIDLRDLLLYNGLDSFSVYWVAMKQMKILGKRK